MKIVNQSFAAFVNMDHRKDRLVHMEKELSRVGISASRFRGMRPEEYGGNPARVEVMRRRTPGAIGCHMSQVAIMEEALKQEKHAFVMEDDLIFCDDFRIRMELVDLFFETHPWDVLWLGGTYHINPPWWHKQDLGKDAEQTDNPRMMRTFGAFSTHAYIVRKSSVALVLDQLDAYLDKTIGIDWSFIQFQPFIQAFAFAPGCVIQLDNQSDIGKGMTIFSGFKKLGPHWFQKRMEDFDPTTYNWHEATKK